MECIGRVIVSIRGELLKVVKIRDLVVKLMLYALKYIYG